MRMTCGNVNKEFMNQHRRGQRIQVEDCWEQTVSSVLGRRVTLGC